MAQRLGHVIKLRRLELDLSQYKFAEAAALPRAYLAAIERGEKAVRLETAAQIARALNLSLSDLVHRMESFTSPLNSRDAD